MTNMKALTHLILLMICAGLMEALFLAEAFAQQSNPTYIQWMGNYRSRFESLHRPAGVSGGKTNRLAHQIILSANFKAQENLKFKASLLGFETWGSDYLGYAGYPYFSGQDQEMLQLYEANAEWNFASGLSVFVGRTPFEIGNGAVFSKNLDDDYPTRFDGGYFQYQTDVARFQLGGFAISSWSSGTTAYDDQDYKIYFLSADLKALEPYVKNISFTFMMLDRDEMAITVPLPVNFPKEEKDIYAVSLTGETGRFFYSFDGVIQEGVNRTSGQDTRAHMLHGRTGFIAYEPWQLGVYIQYHTDTGDNASTANVDESYDPLYYNHFQNAGKMNLLGWSNLTYYSAGLTWVLGSSSRFFLEYNRFYRTSASSGIRGLGALGGNSLVWDSGASLDGPYNNNLNSTEKFIGHEIDLTYELQTESGLRFQSITGLLLPGDYLKVYGKDAQIFFQRLGVEISF